MAARDFAYHRPSTFAEATALLAGLEDGRPLAGGQSIVPQLFSRHLKCDALVDLSDVVELGVVREENLTLVIGAMCRQRELERSPTVGAANPMLAAVLSRLGPEAVRGRATIGGNLAIADPAGELLATAIAQDWQLRLMSAATSRQLPAEWFVTGPYRTMLGRAELLHSIVVPRTAVRAWAVETVRVSRMARPSAGVAIRVALRGSRAVDAAVVAFAVGAAPQRLRAVEALLNGHDVTRPRLEKAALEASRTVDARDTNGVSAEWRRQAIGALTGRAVSKAIEAEHRERGEHV